MALGRKLLVVFNTCGLSGHENVAYYQDQLRALCYQDITRHDVELKIAVSSCCNSRHCQSVMTTCFRNYISYNFVLEPLPLSVTFNDTVDKMVGHFGAFDDYLYLDSGISFWDPSRHWTALREFYDAHKSDDYCMTAAMPSNDDGASWWGINYEKDKDYTFKLAQTTNMHVQFFSEQWRKEYGRVLPDIFASNCMESIFPHMACAIHKKFQMTQKVHLLHAHSMDGPSLAARRPDARMRPLSNHVDTGGKLFCKTKTIDEMYQEAYELGFGFEEFKVFWKHNPEAFDERGFAKNPELKKYFADNLYLNPEEFDYSKINAMFIGGI